MKRFIDSTLWLLRTTRIRWRVMSFFALATTMGALSMAHLVERRLLPQAYGWLFLMLGASLALGWFLARSIDGPLADLQSKIDSLVKDGDDPVLTDRTDDEFADLYESLNQYVLLRNSEDANRASDGDDPAAPPRRSRELTGLRLLLAQAEGLQTAYDFTEGCGQLLAACNAHLRLDWSSICLLDPAGEQLTLTASSGLSEELSQQLAFRGGKAAGYAANEGVSGQVVNQGEPVVLDKGDRDPRFRKFGGTAAETERVRTLACLPLKAGDEVVGIGNFINISSPAGFTELDLTFLQHVMSLVAGLHLKIHGTDEAFREAISGLHGLGYWKSLFAVECQRFRRRPSKLSLLKLTCDFKEASPSASERNDALAAVGSVIREGLRSQDGAARSRESFYLYMPDTDTLGALFLAGRLKDRVDSIGNESPARFETSMGIACCPESVTDPERLIEASDDAVEESFRIGDHRLVCYQGDTATAESRPQQPARPVA